MLEIRLHGRGGQGAVTSAELLALAVINEGKYGQAFPSFGPERRGAPVIAFCRVDEKQIKIRTYVDEPDLVLVLDPSILRIVNVTQACGGGRKQDCQRGTGASHNQYDHAWSLIEGQGSC